ncbi:winged helix-turn-helix transcriptional regulator [Solihabitans fulvus]|uniref:Winged helix-turn-helix transcriptional regulator n=1 Tax=Solihabitans fulvus TaxID=1892852 RepID=A0A5B2X4L2_9PSEU|nr:Lrp/AsnC ligand binding domain-containing protein [Solihabitans fulvus]KAA2258133.1 winged helix-turn-helix transcriptional regulator [Solihabitans fulvus]
MVTLNGLDLQVLRELVASPRIGITELAERLGIARNTAHARTTRLERQGVVGHRGREVDYTALGVEVTAFVTMQVAQGSLSAAVADMAAVPFVLEAHTIAGDGDIMVRVAARNTRHLHEVVNAVLACRGVIRSTTAVALTEQIPFRVGPLLDALEEGVAAE